MKLKLLIINLILLGILLVVTGCKNNVTQPPPPVNNPPVVTSVTAKPTVIKTCPSTNCGGGDGYSSMLTAVANDPDGDSLTYDWSSLPASATFSSDPHVPTAIFVAFLPGYYQITVSVCDPSHECAYGSAFVQVCDNCGGG